MLFHHQKGELAPQKGELALRALAPSSGYGRDDSRSVGWLIRSQEY